MYQQAHEDQRTRPLRLVSIVAPVYNEAPTLREFTHRRWCQIHPPTHLHYFSRNTLDVLLVRVGFEVLGVETAAYYHSVYNVLGTLIVRGGRAGVAARYALRAIGERTARFGLWLNLGDIMFVAARPSTSIPLEPTAASPSASRFHPPHR